MALERGTLASQRRLLERLTFEDVQLVLYRDDKHGDRAELRTWPADRGLKPGDAGRKGQPVIERVPVDDVRILIGKKMLMKSLLKRADGGVVYMPSMAARALVGE
jgi:hypothetical protein